MKHHTTPHHTTPHHTTPLLIFTLVFFASCQTLNFKKSQEQIDKSKTDVADSSPANRTVAMGAGAVAKGMNFLRNRFAGAGRKATATNKIADQLKMGEDIEKYIRDVFSRNTVYFDMERGLKTDLSEDLLKKWTDVIRADFRASNFRLRKNPELLDVLMEEGRSVHHHIQQATSRLSEEIIFKILRVKKNVSSKEKAFVMLEQYQEDVILRAYMKLEDLRHMFRNDIKSYVSFALADLHLIRLQQRLSVAKNELHSLTVQMAQIQPGSSAYKRAIGKRNKIERRINSLRERIRHAE